MPKKLSKSRKRAVRRTHKKSWLQSLFTFPVLFIVAVIGMSIFTVYYVSKPSNNVMGVSTADYVMYTQEQVDALPEKSASAWDYPHYIRTMIWKDADGNGDRNGINEGCLEKKYSFFVNGIQKTRQTENCNQHEYVYVKVPKGCNNVEFIKVIAANPYKFTKLQVWDKDRKSGKIINSKRVKVCGDAEFGEGYGYSTVEFGVKLSR